MTTPSDQDDVLPSSPTANFAETDYDVKGLTEHPLPAAELVSFSPDTDVPDVPEIKRDNYAGTILGWVNPSSQWPRYYWVQRRDGVYGTARALTKYPDADYYPGDGVGLMLGNAADDWVITTAPTPKEQPLLYAKLTNGITTNIGQQLKFTNEIVHTPIDDTFGNADAIQVLNDGSIKVNKPGLYMLDLVAIVTHHGVASPSGGLPPYDEETSPQLMYIPPGGEPQWLVWGAVAVFDPDTETVQSLLVKTTDDNIRQMTYSQLPSSNNYIGGFQAALDYDNLNAAEEFTGGFQAALDYDNLNEVEDVIGGFQIALDYDNLSAP